MFERIVHSEIAFADCSWADDCYDMSLHVPKERIELSWVTPHDFESCASANSATSATMTSLLNLAGKSIMR